MTRRTQKTTDSRGKLDVLLGNSKAKLSGQKKVTLAFRDLYLDRNVLVVGVLSDANYLVSWLVVAELIGEREVNANNRSDIFGVPSRASEPKPTKVSTTLSIICQ